MEALANALKASAISQNTPASVADNTVSVSADVSADVSAVVSTCISKDNSCINNNHVEINHVEINHVEIIFEDRIFKTSWDTLSKSAYFMNIGRLKRDNGQSANKFTIFDKSSDNFAHILNYLRDSRYEVPENLYYEFDYYMIDPPVTPPKKLPSIIPPDDSTIFELVEFDELRANDCISEILITTTIDHYDDKHGDTPYIKLNMENVRADILDKLSRYNNGSRENKYFIKKLLFCNDTADHDYTSYLEILRIYLLLTYSQISENQIMWKYPLLPKNKFAIINKKFTNDIHEEFNTSKYYFADHIKHLFNTTYINNIFVRRLKTHEYDLAEFSPADESAQWLYWSFTEKFNTRDILNKSLLDPNISAYIYYMPKTLDSDYYAKENFKFILSEKNNERYLFQKDVDEINMKINIQNNYANNPANHIWYFNKKDFKKYYLFGTHPQYNNRYVEMNNIKINLFALISISV